MNKEIEAKIREWFPKEYKRILRYWNLIVITDFSQATWAEIKRDAKVVEEMSREMQ
jgi:hypothetical protein